MFEWLLAKKYIIQQKRHSFLTVCSIMTALALITALFTLFSTVFQCLRDIEYDNNPWHYKIVHLTKEKAESLLNLPDFDCNLVIEKDYTCSVELLLKDYTEYNYTKDIDDYWPKLDINKDEQLEVNNLLINYDMITLEARASAVQIFAIFYVFVMFLAIALRMVIDTAFEVSSKERERQFGVLQSIGATPQQIVRIITYEGLFLSCIGVPLGLLSGVGIGYVAFRAILTSGIAETFLHEGQEALLHYHLNALLLVISGITGLVWVLLSAYGTGMRVIRMTPIQAVSNRSNKIMKVRKHSLFGLLFGWKGYLASRNNRRQPKRFFITVLSLSVSITLFASVSIIMEKAHIAQNKMFDELFDGIDYDLLIFTERADGTDTFFQTAEVLENSGYFSEIRYSVIFSANAGEKIVFIRYVNESDYLHLFKENMPVSYEELKKSGGYILSGENLPDGDTFGIDKLFQYKQTEKIDTDFSVEFPVAYRTALPSEEAKWYSKPENIVFLTAPITLYQEKDYQLYQNYDMSNYSDSFSLKLADIKDHQKVLDFIHGLNTIRQDEDYINDYYQERHQYDVLYSSIEIGLNCLNIMFILIAVINMINIVSTGLLNRKTELASLQCLGMTRGQLYGMTVIECIQYALTAGISSTILCELLLILTGRFLKFMDVRNADDEIVFSVVNIINYAEPLPKILLAMLFAFVIAFISSLIPLKSMEKIPLTDQIRSTD